MKKIISILLLLVVTLSLAACGAASTKSLEAAEETPAPVWWGNWPMILYTFFESTPLEGKTLIPFSTHAGSGLSGFDRSLAAAYPDCTVAEGLAIFGADAQNAPDKVQGSVSAWLDGLGFGG